MNVRKTACVAVAIAQLALAGAARAADGPKIEQVLDRMAAALGGRERLARVTSVRTKVRIEAAGLKGTGEGVLAADGRSTSSYDLGVEAGVAVFDGERAWVRDGNGKVREQAGPELEDEVTTAYLGTFSHLLPGRMRGRVELAGEDADRTHYLVRVAPERGQERTLVVDEATGLVAREEHKVGARTSVTVYRDWRDVDGVKFPFEARQRVEGDALETAIFVESVRLNAPVDDAAFRKPEEGASDFRLADAAGAVGIPFELSSNHIYLRVRVNGSEPLWFLFDTGAGTSAISSARAAALGLKTEGQLEARGSGEGTLAASYVRDVTLAMPGVEVTRQTIVAIPLDGIEPFEGRAMDGIVGYDFTSRFVVEIDYAHRKISFYDPRTYVYKGAGERLPIDLRSNIAHVRAAVAEPGHEPVEGVFTVDTGSRSALSLNTPFVESTPWVKALSAKAVAAPFGIGVGGETKTRVGRIGTLRLGRYALDGLVVGFSTDTKSDDAAPDETGNIGGEVLRRFTVVFDYSRKEMILEPNADFADPKEYDMLGALLKLDAGTRTGFAVQRVVESSAAAAAGLAPGDVIVAVDGRPSSEYTLDGVRALFRSAPGRTLTLGVRRGGGETTSVKVTLRRIV
jgi:hypothetical protein